MTKLISSFDIVGRSSAGQVLAIHHVPGGAECHHYYSHTEPALSKTVDAQNGTVGAAHLHPPSAQDPAHAGAETGQRGGRGTHEGTCFLLHFSILFSLSSGQLVPPHPIHLLVKYKPPRIHILLCGCAVQIQDKQAARV